MTYVSEWNLSTIPDEKLRAEWARRSSLCRSTFAGGRPAAIVACPFCNDLLTAVALRAHNARCRQEKLQALVTLPRNVHVVPTYDDLNGAGFRPRRVTRETFYLEKIGYHDLGQIPTRAITNIIIPECPKDAIICVVGRFRFDKATKRCWTFSYGLMPAEVAGEGAF
jgi:hypothetical protein